MATPLNIALVGCGTVGTGVARLLVEHSDRLTRRSGRPLVLKHVVVRNLEKNRDPRIPRAILTTDLDSAINDPAIDVVAELIGGIEPARQIILNALMAGKHVVTANKAVMAGHGTDVFAGAHRANRAVGFEASVGGGMPVINMLMTGLAADRITSLCGILNGTCNFVLTEMSDSGASVAEAVVAAHANGFAEADPTLDLDGTDTAQKLAILSRIAFGVAIDPLRIPRRGIGDLTQMDVELAFELDFEFRLLAEAQFKNHELIFNVGPTLAPEGSTWAEVKGADNAILATGDVTGPVFLRGAGAGMMPTASAVVADLIDIATGRAPATFAASRLWEARTIMPNADAADKIERRYYLRWTKDEWQTGEPGNALRSNLFPIEVASRHDFNEAVVVVTELISNEDLRRGLECFRDEPVYYPITEDYDPFAY